MGLIGFNSEGLFASLYPIHGPHVDGKAFWYNQHMCGLFVGSRLAVVPSCRCRAVDSRPARLRVVVPSSRVASSCRQPHLLMSCSCRAVVMSAIDFRAVPPPSCRHRSVVPCRAAICLHFSMFQEVCIQDNRRGEHSAPNFSRCQEVFIQDICDAERCARQIFSRFQEGCIQDTRTAAHTIAVSTPDVFEVSRGFLMGTK